VRDASARDGKLRKVPRPADETPQRIAPEILGEEEIGLGYFVWRAKEIPSAPAANDLKGFPRVSGHCGVVRQCREVLDLAGR